MDPIDQNLQITKNLQVPYPRERGPMGGAPYIGPRLAEAPSTKQQKVGDFFFITNKKSGSSFQKEQQNN